MSNDENPLALVEQSAGDPAEPDTEHITRLFDTKHVFRELWESRKREKRLEEELSRRPYGGKKMGIGSKLLLVGALAGAAYGVFGMFEAKKETERVKSEWYTSSELVEFTNLREVLGAQLREASAYLERAKDAEIKYKQLATDAIAYIKDSRPRGELEEAAEERIQDMVQYFELCNIDSFIEQVENCGTAHTEMDAITSTKKELQDSVRHANALCQIRYMSFAEHSDDIREKLEDFKDYVQSHPLRGRAANMLQRVQEQLDARPSLTDEGMYYSRMFGQNNDSWGVIPVAPQQNYEPIAKAD